MVNILDIAKEINLKIETADWDFEKIKEELLEALGKFNSVKMAVSTKNGSIDHAKIEFQGDKSQFSEARDFVDGNGSAYPVFFKGVTSRIKWEKLITFDKKQK